MRPTVPDYAQCVIPPIALPDAVCNAGATDSMSAQRCKHSQIDTRKAFVQASRQLPKQRLQSAPRQSIKSFHHLASWGRGGRSRPLWGRRRGSSRWYRQGRELEGGQRRDAQDEGLSSGRGCWRGHGASQGDAREGAVCCLAVPHLLWQDAARRRRRRRRRWVVSLCWLGQRRRRWHGICMHIY